MKNVTIALDEETHRKARIRAAELGTSLSALVKGYLQRLAGGESSPALGGVREMTIPGTHAPSAKADGPPWLVDGKWVYTKDGKPRQPGALRNLPPLADNWDKWPPEMEEFFEKLQTEPWDDTVFDPLPFDESQLPPK